MVLLLPDGSGGTESVDDFLMPLILGNSSHDSPPENPIGMVFTLSK